MKNSNSEVQKQPIEEGDQGGKTATIIGIRQLMKLQGGVGLAQIVAFVLIEMQMAADSILIYNLPYLLLFPKIKCQVSGNPIAPGSTDYAKYCNAEYLCKPQEMRSVTHQVDWQQPTSLNNWIESFNLFCASNFQISLIAMCFFIGQALMCIFIPRLQDKYGRKKVFLASSSVNFLTLALITLLPSHNSKMALSPNTSLQLLDILFFINGLATPGRCLTGYTYFQEMFPEEAQNTIGTIQQFVEGTIYIGLTYFWMKLNYTWRWTIVLACFMNLTGILFTIILLPDSPKWLYENQRYGECIRAIKSMAKINRSRSVIPSGEMYGQVKASPSDSEQKEQLLDGSGNANSQETLVQTSSKNEVVESEAPQFEGASLVNLTAMILVWLSASFCYYLISYQLKYLKGDIFVNGIVSSVSEILAVLFSGLFLSQFGYTRTLTISYVIAFTGMLSLLVTQTSDQRLLIVLILGSKFGVSQVFNLAYLGNMLLFPTSLLASSYGICNLFARAGTIFAPFIAELKPESIAQFVFLSVIGLSLMAAQFIRVPQDNASDINKKSE